MNPNWYLRTTVEPVTKPGMLFCSCYEVQRALMKDQN